MKNLFVVGNGIFPNQDSLVCYITMTEEALAEHMYFLSDVAVLDEAFSSILECLFFRDFFV